MHAGKSFPLPEFLGVATVALTPHVQFVFSSAQNSQVWLFVTCYNNDFFFRCAVWVDLTPLRKSLKKDGSFILWAVWDFGVTVL